MGARLSGRGSCSKASITKELIKMFGKMTSYNDVNGHKLYEFDRVKCSINGEAAKGTIIFRQYPSSDHIKPVVIADRTFWKGPKPVFVSIESKLELLDEDADMNFCHDYDWRATKKA